MTLRSLGLQHPSRLPAARRFAKSNPRLSGLKVTFFIRSSPKERDVYGLLPHRDRPARIGMPFRLSA
ncbi:hypothetical protein PSEUDO9AG_40665 [Pseudomonas sp. 9Ag]|nr:hypothetical protein PSEUDO9AG_40665 [Pseudomonas sp. 9Ag]